MEKRHYEILLVLRHLQEDKAESLIQKYQSLFTKDGEITRFENWGVRQLAYHIDGFSRALYVLFNVHCPATTVDELEKLWKFDDMLLRHLIVRCKSAVTEESPISKANKAKASSRDGANETIDKDALRSEFKQGLNSDIGTGEAVKITSAKSSDNDAPRTTDATSKDVADSAADTSGSTAEDAANSTAADTSGSTAEDAANSTAADATASTAADASDSTTEDVADSTTVEDASDSTTAEDLETTAGSDTEDISDSKEQDKS